MERLTYWTKKDDSSGEWRVNENGTEYTGPHVDRLAEIENILCDDEYEKEYDLDRLRVMMQQRLSLREEVAERFQITKNMPLDLLRVLVEPGLNGKYVKIPVEIGAPVWSTLFCEIDEDGKEHPSGPFEFSVSMLDDWGTGWHETKEDAENFLKGDRE